MSLPDIAVTSTSPRDVPGSHGTVLRVDGIEVHVDPPLDVPVDDTVVMVHGWPDTWRLWDLQVAALAPRRRCVRFTLPGFDPGGPRGAWSLEALARFIGRVVDAVSPDRPVTMLLHDWGCVFGYHWVMQRPERVARVVGIDIGDARSPAHRRAIGVKGLLLIAAYQWWLVAAWRLPPALGDPMTRAMARWTGCRSDPTPIRAQMNYPYDMAWTGSHGGLGELRPFDPPCPYFYAYGARKLFQFHSPEWAAAIARRPGGRVQAFRTGHWVMRGDAAGFNAALREWLDATPAR